MNLCVIQYKQWGTNQSGVNMFMFLNLTHGKKRGGVLNGLPLRQLVESWPGDLQVEGACKERVCFSEGVRVEI